MGKVKIPLCTISLFLDLGVGGHQRHCTWVKSVPSFKIGHLESRRVALECSCDFPEYILLCKSDYNPSFRVAGHQHTNILLNNNRIQIRIV